MKNGVITSPLLTKTSWLVSLLCAWVLSTPQPSCADAAGGPTTVTLTMDERDSQPVDGLSLSGVSFIYTIGGVPSPDAVYRSYGVGLKSFVQEPCIIGPVDGVLGISFSTPTPQVQFGVALDTCCDLMSGFTVTLFDRADSPFLVMPVDTSSPMGLPEGQFTYRGSTLVARLEVAFNREAFRFALDNLTFLIGDSTPPVITQYPSAQSAPASDSCQGSVPDFKAEVLATDDSGVVTVTQEPAAGTTVGLGATSVILTATDPSGNVSTCETTFTVNDLTPPSQLQIVGPIDPVAVGTAIQLRSGFIDNCSGPHTALWEWGDGTSAAGTVDEATASVTGTHNYSAPGVYTVRLSLADQFGNVGTASFRYVVVYDPEGGFVTGGGWIISPAGAYAADPALTGKATLGFVSKFVPGSTVPIGQTDFELRIANLRFHSTSYQWLIINGNKAQYKGIGTLNGAGQYALLLTAIDADINGDGGGDKVRIKIWDLEHGNAVVYDNQPLDPDDADPVTAVGAGNIVVHK